MYATWHDTAASLIRPRKPKRQFPGASLIHINDRKPTKKSSPKNHGQPDQPHDASLHLHVVCGVSTSTISVPDLDPRKLRGTHWLKGCIGGGRDAGRLKEGGHRRRSIRDAPRLRSPLTIMLDGHDSHDEESNRQTAASAAEGARSSSTSILPKRHRQRAAHIMLAVSWHHRQYSSRHQYDLKRCSLCHHRGFY